MAASGPHDVTSSPKGVEALQGIGEKFSSDQILALVQLNSYTRAIRMNLNVHSGNQLCHQEGTP